MSNPSNYGRFYHLVKLRDGGWMNFYADAVEVRPDGSLVAIGSYRGEGQTKPETPAVYLAFAAGEWKLFHAASVLDGGPVNVTHWREKGKVVFEKE